MSFEPVRVARNGDVFRSLAEGHVSVPSKGSALWHADDLALVSITDQAALLADPGTLRVALRKPRPEDDPETVVNVTAETRRGRPVPGKRRCNLAPAIRQLGLTTKAVGGATYPITTKDDLLIVSFTDVPGKDA